MRQPRSWLWGRTNPGESSDPYYDLIDDFDLIVSSFQSQYGLRLSREFKNGMKWAEFKSLLTGIAPDTALGRIVSIRAENDKNVLKHFSREQRQIRSEWRKRSAESMEPKRVEEFLEQLKQTFIDLAEGSVPH